WFLLDLGWARSRSLRRWRRPSGAREKRRKDASRFANPRIHKAMAERLTESRMDLAAGHYRSLSTSRSHGTLFCDGRSPVLPRCAVPALALTARIDREEPRKAGPFVKWAGGKTSLLAELHKHVPARLRGYHEPFVGGGALFFSLRPRRAYLADSNAELIHTYLQIRDDVCAVLDALARHVYERGHFETVRALDPLRLPAAER